MKKLDYENPLSLYLETIIFMKMKHLIEFIIEATDNKGKRRILSIKTCDEETAIAYFETEYDWKLENITEL